MTADLREGQKNINGQIKLSALHWSNLIKNHFDVTQRNMKHCRALFVFVSPQMISCNAYITPGNSQLYAWYYLVVVFNPVMLYLNYLQLFLIKYLSI